MLPTLRRAHIGMSPRIAKEYFWESCESFSIDFASLSSAEVGVECVVVDTRVLNGVLGREV